MNMKIFIILLILNSVLNACLWLEGTTIDGVYKRYNNTQKSFFIKMKMDRESSKAFEYKYKDTNKSTPAYKAIWSIEKGYYKEAITLLLEIEKKHPNQYETATNLGTAYELNGNLDKAYEWIKEGIYRNPNSHYKTEWLHLFIIQEEINLNQDKSLFLKRRMLTLPKDFNENTLISIGSIEKKVSEIKEALYYQLLERVSFIKPKNIIVSELLFVLGEIEAQTTVLNEAEKIFKLAEEYGFVKPKLIENKRHQYSQIYFYSKIFYVILIFLIILLKILMDKYAQGKKNILFIGHTLIIGIILFLVYSLFYQV